MRDFFIPLQTEINHIIKYDRNHCKAQFRVCPQDRCKLRAGTFDCYPTRFEVG